MADFYTSIGNTASRLIDQFGKDVELHREIGGSFDGAAGEETGITTDIQYLKAVILPMSNRAMGEKFKEASLIYDRLSTCKIYGGGLPWSPSLGNNIVFSGEKWEIISNTPLNPNTGDAITHDMVIAI